MRRGISVLVASTLFIVASTQPALADPDLQVAAAQPSSSYEVDHAISFRASLGFDSRLETVRKASTDRDAYPDLTWGIPLSAAEAAEIQRRIKVADAVLPAVEHAERDPTWAGWWMDNASGDVPTLQFAEDVTGKLDDLTARVPAGTPMRVQRVARTLADLDAERYNILVARDDLAERGVTLTAVGIDVPGNRLTVGVTEPSEAARTEISSSTNRPFVVRQVDEGSLDSCPATGCLPVKGGIGITEQGGDVPCTIGYLAKRTDTSPDRLVAVTAGHCIRGMQIWGDSPWRHGSTNIGASATKGGSPVHTFHDNNNADVGLINVSAANRNLVLANTSTELELPFTQAVSLSGQVTGILVCRMGRTTGLQCGAIEIEDDSRISTLGSTTYTIDHVVVYDADALGGDSGGPIFQTVQFGSSPYARLFGTHVHSGGLAGQTQLEDRYNGWYSPWSRGVNVLDNTLGVTISPCLTYSCGLP